MSDLRPCEDCRRHIAVTETACPFCGVACEPQPAPVLRFGRMSRAAMFAGAALASTACGGKKPAPETVENHHEAVTADAAVEQPVERIPPEDEPEPPPPDPQPVPHNVKMPYGAPPMRHRVV